MPTVQAYKASNPKWEYGDAFMVGASTAEATVVDVDKAILLVLTRANTKYPSDFWMNLKEFPKPGPIGPQGPQGEQGIQGEHGLDVTSGTGLLLHRLLKVLPISMLQLVMYIEDITIYGN